MMHYKIFDFFSYLLLEELSTFSSPFWTPNTRKQHTITVNITTPKVKHKYELTDKNKVPLPRSKSKYLIKKQNDYR